MARESSEIEATGLGAGTVAGRVKVAAFLVLCLALAISAGLNVYLLFDYSSGGRKLEEYARQDQEAMRVTNTLNSIAQEMQFLSETDKDLKDLAAKYYFVRLEQASGNP